MRDLSYSLTSNFKVPSPGGLEYLPFQKAGIEFLCKNPNINSLLADPPGLGKTIQTIGFANKLGLENLLIICPASLINNWKNELIKWYLGEHNIQLITGGKQELSKKANINIISYSLVINKEIHKFLQRRGPHLLTLDESQYLKNPEAKRTQAIYNKNLLADKSRYVLPLSGTPIVNRPKEIYATINALCPQAINYMDYERFAMRYCGGYWDLDGFHDDGATNLNELGRRLRDFFMLRRKKADVLTDLPDKFENVVFLDPDQNSKNIMREMKAFNAHDILRMRGVEITFEGLSEMRKDLGLAKVPIAAEYLKTLLDGGRDKIVVFGHHREVLDYLYETMDSYNPVLIHGGTPAVLRQGIVDNFQNDPKYRIFIGGITACGTGITLTASDYMAFIEPSYVPGENEQVIDRIHRIGQKRNVLAEYLLFEDSLDNNIIKSSTRKGLNIMEVMK